MQEKRGKGAKTLHLWCHMYKFKYKQIQFEDFGQPTGMNLTADNRWVKKAESIPWDEIERRYAKLFVNHKGNVAKPLRLALGACIVQAEYGFSDAETTAMIQEHPYIQFFCGYPAYDDKRKPFDPSLMVYFRKRLTPEILGEINELIIAAAEKKRQAAQSTDDNNDDNGDNGETRGDGIETGNDNDGQTESDSDETGNDSVGGTGSDGEMPEPPQNGGTMIIDATCAPSQIKYPQDTELLNDAREASEGLIDALHTVGTLKPRTYRRKARKDYLSVARSRKPGVKKIRKAISRQLGYLRRNLESLRRLAEGGTKLTRRQRDQLATLEKIYEQQKFMYDNRVHSVPDRIVSLSQPWIRPIVRGKANKPVEFGAKLDISVANGWTRLEYASFDAYNESTKLVDMLERYRERTGRYPARVLADKIYRNRENLRYCTERGIRLSGPALGRPKKGEVRDKKRDYRDECERVEVERRFSLAKRKCGLGLIVARLSETAKHCIAMSVVLLNLKKALGLFFALFGIWYAAALAALARREFAFVQ